MTYELAKKLKTPKEKLEKVAKYQRENPEKVKESKRKTHWTLKLKIITHYGGKCTCCEEKEIRFLCIDHINNDGKKHRVNGQYSGGTGLFYY